jgi:hypothetical protein
MRWALVSHFCQFPLGRVVVRNVVALSSSEWITRYPEMVKLFSFFGAGWLMQFLNGVSRWSLEVVDVRPICWGSQTDSENQMAD